MNRVVVWAIECLVIAAALATAGCGGGGDGGGASAEPEPPPSPTVGTLVVYIDGRPAGANASIAVTAANGYSRRVSARSSRSKSIPLRLITPVGHPVAGGRLRAGPGVAGGSTRRTACNRSLTGVDGTRKRTAWLNPNLVAEFAASDTRKHALAAGSKATGAVKSIDATAKLVGARSGSVACWSVGDAQSMMKALAVTAPAGQCGQVLHEGNSSSAPRLSLQGDVIVKFKAEWTRDDIDQWIAARRLNVVHSIDVKGNYFLIAAPPDLASLDIANAIHESGDVLLAMPNWWMDVRFN